MTFGEWALWGFAATVVLTTIMAGSQGLGLTRMNLPYMLGTLFTPHRDRARLIGIAVHLVNGWIFALLYLALFRAWGSLRTSCTAPCWASSTGSGDAAYRLGCAVDWLG